jgi:hypothetical protein
VTKPIEEMEIDELFSEADRIGSKYQTSEEIATFKAEYQPVVADIAKIGASLNQTSKASKPKGGTA